MGRDETIAELRREFGNNLRLLAQAQDGDITAGKVECERAQADMEAAPAEALKGAVARLSHAKLKRLYDAIGKSRNPDHKVGVLASYLFEAEKAALADKEAQAKQLGLAFMGACRLLVAEGFMNEQGDVQWQEAQKMMNTMLDERARADERANIAQGVQAQVAQQVAAQVAAQMEAHRRAQAAAQAAAAAQVRGNAAGAAENTEQADMDL